MIDPQLLELLACPACKAAVRLDVTPPPCGGDGERERARRGPPPARGERLVCTRCGRRYPIRDGIPVMLIEEAEPPVQEQTP